jgi:guanosine-3',5'-bis(diphosphate) 3'-pyrophosphohydrolase
MRYFQIALLTCVIASTSQAYASDQRYTNHQETQVIKEMELQLSTCRQFVSNSVHGNISVLNQFDVFAQNLKQAYLSHEGLDQNDLNHIFDAITFSADKHRFQARKDPDQTPYIIHPIGVANTLITIGNVRDADIVIGALLHDTVEDTETTFEEIEARFGINVTNLVREVTDDKSLPKHVRKQLQVEHAPHKSAGAAQIKLADKLYNLSDLAKAPPSDWEAERVDAYFLWAQSVVDGLPNVNPALKQAVDQVIANH